MKGTVGLHELYRRYHDRVRFLSIYIREAHPTDGWWLGKGAAGWATGLYAKKAAKDVRDPTTIEERRAVAGRCETSLQYGIRTYVDEMDDAVNRAYAAWPTRLYLIDVTGRVVYHGGPGPFGFSPRKFGAAIERYLTDHPKR